MQRPHAMAIDDLDRSVGVPDTMDELPSVFHSPPSRCNDIQTSRYNPVIIDFNKDHPVLFDRPAPSNDFQRSHVDLMLASYRHWTGESLLGQDPLEDDTLGERIFHAPFALLSHGTESDPVFNYANTMALEVFGYDWHEWIRLPSRYSAEAPNREARQKLLDEVREKGFSDGYEGIRIGKNGRFLIRSAKVWNLLDRNGLAQGQAACFTDWERLPKG